LGAPTAQAASPPLSGARARVDLDADVRLT